ncbi:MAG: amino acid ABC transporter permease [Clostridia bacterium]|nr:amino acid ABC transporter permease [Clostridia bacterium]
MFKSALDFKLEFEESIVTLLGQAQEKETDCAIYLYQTNEGITLYASDETVNAVYGGIIDVINESSEITTYKLVDGTEKEILSKNVNKGFAECFKTRRNANKPDTSTPLIRWWNGLKDDFHKNFIEKDRWHTILTGLWTTIKLTICALLIGIVLGFLVAFVRCTYLKTAKKGIILKLLNSLCQIYLTVIRGTPVVVQIMIIYFVVFMPMGVDKFLSAVICFGLNSGAYVAEIVRGGIMSIDDGQSEAGRSLGFGYMQTMWLIVFPQAFKAVLPALANEFVVLLKETSIAFYIGLGDLMYAGNAIRAATYSAFMPLIAVAVIYFIMVLALSKLVSLLERRLRKNER